MFKHILTVAIALFSTAGQCASLTPLETRWLVAGSPVLAFAKRINLPIDIIVQPQARAGDVPLAMGFDNGRCKLVLSMRGNPDAEATLKGVPAAQHSLMIEAMTAHEVGHCWRYVQGVWHALPAGFVETGDERADDAATLAEMKAMRENRREEGFADLVALAWVQRFHPEHYARVHGWLDALRSEQPVARNAHDTRVWVRMARDASVFGAGATPFDQAAGAWRDGLLRDE